MPTLGPSDSHLRCTPNRNADTHAPKDVCSSDLRKRERQKVSGGGAEREGDTESEAGSRLRAISPEPDAGLEPTDREILTWLKSDA